MKNRFPHEAADHSINLSLMGLCQPKQKPHDYVLTQLSSVFQDFCLFLSVSSMIDCVIHLFITLTFHLFRNI